jgi:hypothetical protein
MELKEQVLKDLEKCIKYDFLSEAAIKKINEIIIEELEEDKNKGLSPDDLKREIDSSCESGICPVR